ncbi:MAG: hypothetical protein HY808_02205 [Nitrospirae bacterium]|nr:hypothetical protein [Nitrospirota bacterium]
MSINKCSFTLYLAICMIIAFFSVSDDIVQASSIPNLVVFRCNGEVKIYAGQQYEKLTDKMWLGDIQRGYLFKEDFFYIDNDRIKSTNLLLRNTHTISDLKENLGRDQLPWQIGYVDDGVIYFSAYKYDKNRPINKQQSLAFIYRLNRKTKGIEKLNIAECCSPYFSVHQDNIYFTATSGEIHKYADGNITSLYIKGDFPSVSPDGTKIAFVSFGLINERIILYNIQNKNRISLISFLGPKSVDPIIRWSNNSEFIAVKQKSDIASKPLYLVSTINEKVIQKVTNNYACNWFLIDENKISKEPTQKTDK